MAVFRFLPLPLNGRVRRICGEEAKLSVGLDDFDPIFENIREPFRQTTRPSRPNAVIPVPIPVPFLSPCIMCFVIYSKNILADILTESRYWYCPG